MTGQSLPAKIPDEWMRDLMAAYQVSAVHLDVFGSSVIKIELKDGRPEFTVVDPSSYLKPADGKLKV